VFFGSGVATPLRKAPSSTVTEQNWRILIGGLANQTEELGKTVLQWISSGMEIGMIPLVVITIVRKSRSANMTGQAQLMACGLPGLTSALVA